MVLRSSYLLSYLSTSYLLQLTWKNRRENPLEVMKSCCLTEYLRPVLNVRIVVVIHLHYLPLPRMDSAQFREGLSTCPG